MKLREPNLEDLGETVPPVAARKPETGPAPAVAASAYAGGQTSRVLPSEDPSGPPRVPSSPSLPRASG